MSLRAPRPLDFEFVSDLYSSPPPPPPMSTPECSPVRAAACRRGHRRDRIRSRARFHPQVSVPERVPSSSPRVYTSRQWSIGKMVWIYLTISLQFEYRWFDILRSKILSQDLYETPYFEYNNICNFCFIKILILTFSIMKL